MLLPGVKIQPRRATASAARQAIRQPREPLATTPQYTIEHVQVHSCCRRHGHHKPKQSPFNYSLATRTIVSSPAATKTTALLLFCSPADRAPLRRQPPSKRHHGTVIFPYRAPSQTRQHDHRVGCETSTRHGHTTKGPSPPWAGTARTPACWIPLVRWSPGRSRCTGKQTKRKNVKPSKAEQGEIAVANCKRPTMCMQNMSAPLFLFPGPSNTSTDGQGGVMYPPPALCTGSSLSGLAKQITYRCPSREHTSRHHGCPRPYTGLWRNTTLPIIVPPLSPLGIQALKHIAPPRG